ncbi:hypothetical protein FUAX_45890 (plasmid) [Fulvitalea axinellae]|uniref:Glycosyl hydrolases family 43 n=1 Tax=Fulvitalea axinellae TaxID=1182444 RepID=A0AAU9D3M3_9BACT|nr:hypothetical protein FUAX_45890 [Fulvitalea axinellae]
MLRFFFYSLIATVVWSCSSGAHEGKKATSDKLEKPVIVGEWKHIFNPNDTRSDIDTTWYTNDHCFAKGPDGKWHAYGIIGHKPIDPWKGETKFFHISADKFNQDKWEDHDYALRTKPGVEKVLWAPTIFQEPASDVSHMFYNIGNMQEHARKYTSWGFLCRADSKDMFEWKRHPLNPQFSDPGHARDAFVMKDGGKYYFYYTRAYTEVDRRSSVGLRTSPDLEHWSGPRIVHSQDSLVSTWAGGSESPFVVKRRNIFYLFVCRAHPKGDYNQTHVYWSKDPEDFPLENLVCELPTHASEIIKVSDNEWYISNTGWDKKGLFIARLEWQ